MRATLREFSWLLVLGILPIQCFAKDTEDIFAAAKSYTVRINATIATPFIEDKKGARFGAGFIVDKNRQWLLTNAHVVGRSPSTLEAIFEDGTRVEARKIYVDPYIDIAIIELLDDLPSSRQVTLACDKQPAIGHPVGAYGHPWGFNFTGTQGVVSGSTTIWGAELLQTDTPINGGNSGGPLISLKSGKVVAINTSRFNRDDDQNTNFAVPISQACRILTLLKEGKDPSPPELLTTFYNVIGDDPLIVARSYLDEDLLQLREGDEILAVNNTAVTNESELMHALRGTLDEVELTVQRENQVIRLNGRLNAAPSIIGRRGLYFAGLLFANGGFRDNAALEIGHDVMINSIARGSQADGDKLHLYDNVARINNVPVISLDHLNELLSVPSESGEVQVDFLRLAQDGDTRHLFHSLRRIFKWSKPEQLGFWDGQDTETLQTKE